MTAKPTIISWKYRLHDVYNLTTLDIGGSAALDTSLATVPRTNHWSNVEDMSNILSKKHDKRTYRVRSTLRLCGRYPRRGLLVFGSDVDFLTTDTLGLETA